MNKKLEKELKTIQNMLVELLASCPRLHKDVMELEGGDDTEHYINYFRPAPEPIKDLKWKETTKYEEMQKE